jgi:hypothetical protein
MVSGRVPAALRTRLGDDGTFGLIELLDSERKDWSEQVVDVAADRFERRLTDEISELREDIRNALHDGLTAVRAELTTNRVEQLRWSFVFWVGQVAAIALLLSYMLRGGGK